MNVVQSERVKTSLRTLSRDDRDRVLAWLDYFRSWDTDEFVKSRSVLLDVQGQKVYMFRTSTEIRIFYTVDEENESIEVIDVTTKDTILATGATSA